MAKYNYDKSVLKGLGVGAFLNETKVREQHIASANDTIPSSIYNPNVIAKELHPDVQYGVIDAIYDHKDGKTYKIVPDKEKGFEHLAYFRAGQYVTIDYDIDGAFMSKPYTLSGNPKDALNKDEYYVTIKRNLNGYSSDYALDKLKVNDKLTLSGPLGDFYYERLRDAKNVIALAGGSGITPFISMAQAIADKTEDFNLTILYGSKKYDSILLKDYLDDVVEKASGKVKVIHVLSDDKHEGCEEGFLTAELIKKYVPKEDYSIFVCGPKAMYSFLEKELTKLELPKRRIRYELAGEYGDPTNDEKYPKDKANEVYKITVVIKGEETIVDCKARETLLHAMEQKGLKAPSHCRSGICGWCHSRLIEGDVYIPEKADGRRMADKKFGWIHPCATYPLSDCKLEIFPVTK